MKLRVYLCLVHKRDLLEFVNRTSGMVADTTSTPSVQLCEDEHCGNRVDFKVELRLNA